MPDFRESEVLSPQFSRLTCQILSEGHFKFLPFLICVLHSPLFGGNEVHSSNVTLDIGAALWLPEPRSSDTGEITRLWAETSGSGVLDR